MVESLEIDRNLKGENNERVKNFSSLPGIYINLPPPSGVYCNMILKESLKNVNICFFGFFFLLYCVWSCFYYFIQFLSS